MEKDLKKHTSAIHTKAKLSLLERKISNVLLCNAYDDLLLQRQHTVNISILCEVVGHNSNERNYIKSVLERLTTIPITWNYLDSDGVEEWGVSSLLSSAKIKNGILTYEYSLDLSKKLSDPKVYGIINLQMQRKFISGYSLALYEICCSYKGLLHKRDQVYTKWMTLETFKELLGLEKLEYYDDFKRLNNKIIKHAISEINGSARKYSSTDILIQPEFKKQNRKISDIRFIIKKHPQMSLFNTDKNDDQRHTDVYKRLLAYGFSDKGAINIIKTETAEYIKEKLDLVDKELREGRINISAGGLLSKALKEDYKPANIIIEQAKKKKIEERKKEDLEEQNKAEKKKAEEKKNKEEIEKTLDEFCLLSENEKNTFREEFYKTLNKFERKMWDENQNKSDNPEIESPAIRIIFSQFLKKNKEEHKQ